MINEHHQMLNVSLVTPIIWPRMLENGAAKEIRLDLRITKVEAQDWTSIKQIYGR